MKPDAMHILENKIPPPVTTILIGAAMWGAAKFLPAMAIPLPLRYGLVGLISVFALLVAGSAMLAFRRAKTTINPVQIEKASQMVTGGIFAYTRNPMYVGLTALLTSWAVWLTVPWTLLGPVVFALFTQRFQIIPEERVMRAKFGRAFDEYRKQVRRWL
jgi:protein-S-isoprenylcysteine O-methyltransferase Ste14